MCQHIKFMHWHLEFPYLNIWQSLWINLKVSHTMWQFCSWCWRGVWCWKLEEGVNFKAWSTKKKHFCCSKVKSMIYASKWNNKITLHYFEMDKCKVVENILMKHSVSRHLEEKFVQVVWRKQWVWPKSR